MKLKSNKKKLIIKSLVSLFLTIIVPSITEAIRYSSVSSRAIL